MVRAEKCTSGSAESRASHWPGLDSSLQQYLFAAGAIGATGLLNLAIAGVSGVLSRARREDYVSVLTKVRDDFERARDTVKQKPRAKLTVQAPEGCATSVDGRPAPGPPR